MVDTVVRFVETFGGSLNDPGRLGGKGASLTRLVELGYRVPPGFTLTVDAFRATIRAQGLGHKVERIGAALDAGEDAGPDGEAVRSSLMTGPIPAEVRRVLHQTVDDLGLWVDNREGVIVRSSATAEDSSGLSFAGIFESIAIDGPEDLEGAVREVWASAFSPRALSYARERGLQALPEMAVVVQRFLEAERSGVMFTRFAGPAGDEQILIEHVEGGCEKL